MAGTRRRKTPDRRAFGNVRKLPSGRFQARYTDPGTGQVVKAPVTFDTQGDAEAWLTVRHGRVITGQAFPEQDREQAPTLTDYAADWLAGRELTPRTRHEYVKLLEQHVEPTFGTSTLDTITAAQVRKWHVEVGTRTGPTRRAHAYALLRSIMGGAVDDGLIPSNPCQVKGASRAPRVRQIQPATLDELVTITAHMPDRLRLAVLLSSWCGLRFGEVTELRRKDVNTRSHVIHVRRGVTHVAGEYRVGPPKSSAGIRDVPIPPHLLPVLKDHLKRNTGTAAEALLFAATGGGHLSSASLYEWFYPAREAAGRPDLRWHDLRHTGAVMVASTGATIAELMAWGGWSTPTMAMRYQHVAAGRPQAIAAALSELANVDE